MTLHDGSPITLLVRRFDGKIDIHKTRVRMQRYGRRNHVPFAFGRRLRESREGLEWVRGHEGEDVEALIVASAL